MATNQNTNSGASEEDKLPVADTGNASNPSPHNEKMEPAHNQLLDEKGEKYLREVASIEDLPDPQEEQEADEIIQKENRPPSTGNNPQ